MWENLHSGQSTRTLCPRVWLGPLPTLWELRLLGPGVHQHLSRQCMLLRHPVCFVSAPPTLYPSLRWAAVPEAWHLARPCVTLLPMPAPLASSGVDSGRHPHPPGSSQPPLPLHTGPLCPKARLRWFARLMPQALPDSGRLPSLWNTVPTSPGLSCSSCGVCTDPRPHCVPFLSPDLPLPHHPHWTVGFFRTNTLGTRRALRQHWRNDWKIE